MPSPASRIPAIAGSSSIFLNHPIPLPCRYTATIPVPVATISFATQPDPSLNASFAERSMTLTIAPSNRTTHYTQALQQLHTYPTASAYTLHKSRRSPLLLATSRVIGMPLSSDQSLHELARRSSDLSCASYTEYDPSTYTNDSSPAQEPRAEHFPPSFQTSNHVALISSRHTSTQPAHTQHIPGQSTNPTPPSIDRVCFLRPAVVDAAQCRTPSRTASSRGPV